MYFIQLSNVFHSIVIVGRMYFTPNKTETVNPYVNSDIIYAFFEYSNPSFIRHCNRKLYDHLVFQLFLKSLNFYNKKVKHIFLMQECK